MRRIADAQQPVGMPSAQPVDADVQMLDVVHRGQGVDPAGELGHERGDVRAEALDAPGPHLRVGALVVRCMRSGGSGRGG